MITPAQYELFAAEYGDQTMKVAEHHIGVTIGVTAAVLGEMHDQQMAGVPTAEQITLADYLAWQPSDHPESARELNRRAVDAHIAAGVPNVRHLPAKIDWATYGKHLAVTVIGNIETGNTEIVRDQPTGQPARAAGEAVVESVAPGSVLLYFAENALAVELPAYSLLFGGVRRVLQTPEASAHMRVYQTEMAAASRLPDIAEKEGRKDVLRATLGGQLEPIIRGGLLADPNILRRPRSEGGVGVFNEHEIVYLANAVTHTPPSEEFIAQLRAIDAPNQPK